MSLGILLAGRAGVRGWIGREVKPAVLAERARRWLARATSADLRAMPALDSADDSLTIRTALHPAPEDLIVRIGGNRCEFECNTFPAGPGYHRYVCELIDGLAKFLRIEWVNRESGDESGYFAQRDFGVLQERSLEHLHELLGSVCDLAADGARDLMVAMPLGHQYSCGSFIMTQLGPQTRDWVNSVLREPNRGAEFFPWWSADRDAAFYRNRALVRMWMDVRWRPPLTTAEQDVDARTLADLEQAFMLDAEAEYPWAEWLELLDISGAASNLKPEIARRAAEAPPAPRIGYRRRAVCTQMPTAWTIRIPGEFAEYWAEDGSGWAAWDAERSVHVSTLEYEHPEDGGGDPALAVDRLPFDEESDDLVSFSEKDRHGRARRIRQNRGEMEVWALTGIVAIPNRLAVVSVEYRSDADHAWAEDCWRSLRYNP